MKIRLQSTECNYKSNESDQTQHDIQFAEHRRHLAHNGGRYIIYTWQEGNNTYNLLDVNEKAREKVIAIYKNNKKNIPKNRGKLEQQKSTKGEHIQ